MSYLYHIVPQGMRGKLLYPLNTLKTIYPDLYEAHAKKYIGREQLMEIQIPRFGCLWNDVLQFTAIHPNDIRDALAELGYKWEFRRTFFQVDANMLEPQRTLVFLDSLDCGYDVLDSDCVPYHPDGIGKYATLPQATKSYYKQCINQDQKPLLFNRSPHILYQGTLDITGLSTIEVMI